MANRMEMCRTCGLRIEWVDCKNPYWRHIEGSTGTLYHRPKP
jgi:hypothetical protein